MNFDMLLSKYLDGFLTVEEDSRLRCLLSQHPELREEFDLAVSMHIAMKQSKELSNTLYTNEFYSDIEQNILSAIDDPVKFSSTVPPLQLFRKPLFQSAFIRRQIKETSAIAAALMLALGTISDDYILPLSSIARFETVETNIVDESEVVGDVAAASAFRSFRSELTPHIKHNANFSTLGDIKTAGQSFIADNVYLDREKEDLSDNSPVFLPKNETTEFTEVYQEFSSSDIAGVEIPLPVSSFSLLSQIRSYNNDEVFSKFVETEKSASANIHVNTFVSNGVILAKDNPIPSLSFSQSVGYEVAPTTKVGLEVGYTGYSLSDNVNADQLISTVSLTRSGKGTTTLGSDGPDGEKKTLPGQLPQSSGAIAALNRSVNLYWGAAFVEHSLYSGVTFSVNARIGAGASAGGAFAFSRAYAKYSVASIVSLTAGAESKVFAPGEIAPNQANSAETAVGLVYGVEIKF